MTDGKLLTVGKGRKAIEMSIGTDDWLLGQREEAEQSAYKFFMRPDPDMREFLGPIEYEYDELAGKTAKFRMAKIAMMRGMERNREVKVFLGFDGKPCIPHIRLKKARDLHGWYQNKGAAGATSRERPCMTDAISTEPYGGYCTVGCVFCYINSGVKGYRGSGLVTVPENYGDHVRRQLATMRTASAGYFSSNIDPFLPIEDVYHNTQNGAQAFVDNGLPVFFLSRLAYPSWAIDMLKKNRYSYAQKSMSTPDEEDWKKLSPGALSISEHLDEIRELRQQGIYTSVHCNPIIPGVTTLEEVEELFHLLAEAGNNHVIIKFVEAGYSWAPAMVERITKKFGENRGKFFASLFTDNMGGQKCVDEEWRMAAHRRLQPLATKLGMTYATCFEYKYIDRAADGSLLSKRTKSIGPEFLTGDQCHGRRVPMFTRLDTAVPFSEVLQCNPSGCLACGNGNAESRGACGSLLFGAAKANQLADYRKSVYEK